MFGALFDEDAATGGSSGGRKTSTVPEARGPTGFCGLDNLGTTCYLNSLLQSMFLTPGFRDALFRISCEDLGYKNVDGENTGNTRTIPFELQSLFAAMARQDQSSVSTEALTKSFGWSANDAVVQHDVQELNRVLFDAIEQSLVGTPHAGLIEHLYGGSLVNLIKCRACNTERCRDERFLDLTVPMQGLADLPAGLASFTTMEVLDGANQYRCETCASLQDAEKGIRLRHLPPILALSLNRFSYDWQRDTRVKITTAFPFPLTLNMAPYCTNPPEHADYELYSVVIHGGAAHGGHYHAYIRDIYGEGTWSKPTASGGDVPLTREPKDAQTGRKGKARASTASAKIPQDPLPLLQRTVLELSQQRAGITGSDISKRLVEVIGSSWNVAYKNRLGSLLEFLKKHKGIFVVKGDVVSLTDEALVRATTEVAATSQHVQSDANSDGDDPELQVALALSLEPSGTSEAPDCQHWFDFNDSRVSCIPVSAIEKQFGGKESAYMLFYANRAFVQAQRRPVLPDPWRARMDTCNMLLTEARRAADVSAHTLELRLHLCTRYALGTVLQPRHDEFDVPFSIDDRTPTSALPALLRDQFPELSSCTVMPFHVATPLRDGQLALAKELRAESESSTILADGFRPQMHVFVGTVASDSGEKPRVGTDVLAVRVTDARADAAPERTLFAYPDTLLQRFRADISVAFACGVNDFVIVRSDRKQWTKAATLAAFAPDKDQMNLMTLGVKDNMQLLLIPPAAAEPEAAAAAAGSEADATSKPTPKAQTGPSDEVLRRIKDTVTVSVAYLDGKKLPAAVQLSLDTGRPIAECRAAVAAALGCDVTGTRLKVQRQAEWELLAPEETTAKAANIDGGTVLGLEHGPLPAADELFLLVRVNAKKDTPLLQVVLQDSMTIATAVATLAAEAALPAGDYHLARTNWTGDPDKAFTDMEQTLKAAGLTHNTTLSLQAGRVVPKGHSRVGMFLDVQSLSDEMRALVEPHLKLPDRRNPDEIVERLADLSLDQLVQLTDAVFPLTATVADIKTFVLAQPAIAAVCGSAAALRVRDLEGLRMTRVLSDETRQLKQLKFPPTGKHLAFSIVPEGDVLDPATLFLNVCLRLPALRKNTRPRPILFNGGNAPTLEQLVNVLSVEFSVAPDDMVVAKYDKSAREWKVLASAATARKSPRKRTQAEGSLRDPPHQLKDGDLIALKKRSDDPKDMDNFALSMQRETPAASGAKRAARPEPRLAIHVPAFSHD